MKMHRFLITGGAGFIGSHVAKKILKKFGNSKVVIFDNYARYQDPLKFDEFNYLKLRFSNIKNKVTFERGDAKNSFIVYDILKKHKPNYIIHLAAVPLARTSNLNVGEMKNGSVDTTSCLIENLNKLKKEKEIKINKFLYISSSMVYGDFKNKSVKENDETNPKDLYGIMKLAGENITIGLCQLFNIPFSIIRPSAVYGPTDINHRVSQIFLEKAIKKEKIVLYGKDEMLDFTYVDDIAEGIIIVAISKKSNGETFNITFGKARLLMDYINILKNYFPDLNYQIKPRNNLIPKRGTLSIQKARDLLNFKPLYNLEKGIQKYVETTITNFEK